MKSILPYCLATLLVCGLCALLDVAPLTILLIALGSGWVHLGIVLSRLRCQITTLQDRTDAALATISRAFASRQPCVGSPQTQTSDPMPADQSVVPQE